MPVQRKHTRPHTSRGLTWACLVLVPALAIVALGTSITFTSGGMAAPGGINVADTRELAAHGDAVTGVTKPADIASYDGFMDTWQNTVRLPPSPRR
jgi:hypothetical protein